MTLIGLNSNVFTPVATGDAPAVTPTSPDVSGTSGNLNLVVDSKTYTPTAPNTADVTGSNDPTGSKDSTGDDRFDEFGNYISYYDAKPEIKAKYINMAREVINTMKEEAETSLKKDIAKTIKNFQNSEPPEVNSRYTREGCGTSAPDWAFNVTKRVELKIIHYKNGSVKIESQRDISCSVPDLDDVAEVCYRGKGLLKGY